MFIFEGLSFKGKQENTIENWQISENKNIANETNKQP